MAHTLSSLTSLKLSRWIRVCTGGLLILFSAGVFLMERQGAEETLQHAEDQSETMARSLAQHAGDTFQMADLALVSLSRILGTEPPTRSKLLSVQTDMRELLSRVPRLHGLAYYEESGWRLAGSEKNANEVVNESRSAFFQFHRRQTQAGLFVGPAIREADGTWVITISRRIAKEDGSFNGVLVATIESRYFSDFYQSFDTGIDVRVVMLGPDGAVMARNPYDTQLIGKSVANTPVVLAVQAGDRSGVFRMPSPLDGVERLSAFHAVEGVGVTIVYSLSRKTALAPWHQGIYVRVAVFILLAIALVLGGLRLAQQAERRHASEKNLLQLSLTDSLTGLLNRRGFDQAMAMAWRQSSEAGLPLSLLMIDVDCFKSFNDTYGHPAGDTCLQLVALSICSSVPFSEERVARYGGEEIVVILPDTSAEAALAVAEEIRSSISALRVKHAKSAAANHLTVSIGCATERPAADFRTAPAELLADADRALYEAKLSGRDRVVSFDQIEFERQRTVPPLRLVTASG